MFPASAFAADGTVNLTASIDANYLEANGSSSMLCSVTVMTLKTAGFPRMRFVLS